MLIIAGLGLGDEKDITIRELELAKASDACFIELYTSKWFGTTKSLENILNRKISILNRSDLEENMQNILDLAKNKDVFIFVPGDPLLATTHINLIFEAKKKEIKTLILHNSSIFSAIGESGLHIYKFGKCATVPFSGQLNYVRDTVAKNKEIDAHTLILLDVDYENKRYMDVKTAIKMLLDEKILDKSEKIVIMSKLGNEDKKIAFGAAEAISKHFSKDDVPAVIIIPSKLHFSEKEYLAEFEVR